MPVACRPCVEEHRAKLNTATAVCADCGHHICRSHTRRQDGVTRCKKCAKVEKDKSVEKIQGVV